ncbi:MAG: type I restriction-modification system subunit M [Arcicella sp.]|nr:type I restriction-modification system subunit M [Arcicella sp.]
MSLDYKKQLEQQLWNIANTLRGKMNADEFRDYILGFIFYKYLSERMNLFADKLLVDSGEKVTYKEIKEGVGQGSEFIEAIREEAVHSLGYFLKPNELFSFIAQKGNIKDSEEAEEDESTATAAADNFILDELTTILTNIEQSTQGTDSEDDFIKLFEDLDLTSSKLGRTEKEKNRVIAKVLAHLDKIDFRLEDTESDVLGDAYEYLIGQFASGAGKKAGEFYTPQAVSTILARLVTTGKTKLLSVYDPTCGSGSLLLRVAKEVKDVANFYGQEMNRTTYNLARMNMILHGVHFSKFDIKQEDTLERPQHLGMKFEAIVANPPFSQTWSANPLHLSDERFSQYGKLAPASKADFAFIQHMIAHLADNGSMAVVAPHGILFRGAAEGHIRKYIIEDLNYLDAVIGLPPNVFFGTSIPTSILVFKACRENPDNILFVDASQHFEKAKNQNFLRESDIHKIVETYRKREYIEKYSHVVPVSVILANDFNLNIPRYVDTFEEQESINITDIAQKLKTIESDIKDTDQTIAAFCNELGIETPF